MQFKSLPQLLDYFKDEKTCIEYYEQIRWGAKRERLACPFCGAVNPYTTNRGYKCREKACFKKFTCKVGTIFEASKIPFRIWFAAIFLATSHKKGISSLQLGVDLDLPQKTAWFVLHRIREMLKAEAPEMLGDNKIVESDETLIGGRESNKHKSKRTIDGSHFEKKQIVLGLIERDGKVVLKHIPSANKENMLGTIEKHIPKGTTIYTDELGLYRNLKNDYKHDAVNHSLQVYVVGNVHTNTIENFWSVLKRGLYGVYHCVSPKHLNRYLDEFANRFNERDTTSQQKFEKFLGQSDARRLTYNKLIEAPSSDLSKMGR